MSLLSLELSTTKTPRRKRLKGRKRRPRYRLLLRSTLNITTTKRISYHSIRSLSQNLWLRHARILTTSILL